MLPNILQSKGNQTVKFGQVLECNKIFSLKNQAKNNAGRLVPDRIWKSRVNKPSYGL